MFKFLKNGFTHEAPDSHPVPHAVPHAAPASVKPHADIQRELVRVVLKDTLRRHGIPSEKLACEVNTVANGPGGEELHIQLVMMQWHELLLRYAPALEIQLLRGLDWSEPTVDHAKKCTITWRFSPECGCPFTVMPPPVVWSHDAAPAQVPVAKEPPSILDRRQKRRPLKVAASAPRSAPPAAPPAAPLAAPPTPRRGDNGPEDYERTELSPFR